MKADFPSIKISGITKKVYSVDLSGGGSEPSILRLSFIWGKEDYNLNTKSEIVVSIGNFYTFKGHAISFSTKESVTSGKTCELTLVDTSVILDKIYVGLKGKDGGTLPNILKQNTTQVALPGNINLNNYLKTSSVTPSLVSNKVSNLSIYRAVGDFSNMIFVGDYIDPCGNLENDSEKDKCDPCTSNTTPNNSLDCQKSRGFSKLDVDYKFSDLIQEASRYGVNFNNTFSSPVDYRAQYTGTLREVLNNWCQDFGFSFYWKNDTVIFFDLSRGININDSTIKDSNNCKIEEVSTSKSIEGLSKDINIAYFGKDGEIKEYDCSSNTGGGSGSSRNSNRTLFPISLDKLSNGNRPLERRYGSEFNFQASVIASYYSKELRDLFCYVKVLEYTSPDKVKLGTGNNALLGWNIKAICHENTTDKQAGKKGKAQCQVLYNNIIGSSNPSLGGAFTEEKIKELKEGGAYLLIVEETGTKAYDFELQIAKTFCGKYWSAAASDLEDKSFESPDGTVKGFSRIKPGNKFVFPDINISHPYIRAAEISKFAEKNIVVLDRTPIWQPDPNSENVEKFIDGLKPYVFLDRTSEGGAALTDKEKLYLVWSFGENKQPDIECEISNGISPDENENTEGLGAKSNKCKLFKFYIKKTKGTYTRLPILSPIDSNYVIKVIETVNSFNFGKIKAIIPKLELVFATQGNQNDKYVSIRANTKDITNGDISNLERNDNRCYIDEAKIKTYADKILFNLNTNLQEEKETKTYSIFGLPNSLLGPEDGLVSFSIRLDQSGTRTNLTFSNSFPVNSSDSVKTHQLNNALRSNPGKSYINII
jgi:hypothetical protein